jgi:hypothetical protein
LVVDIPVTSLYEMLVVDIRDTWISTTNISNKEVSRISTTNSCYKAV